jgi:hypothetical protein
VEELKKIEKYSIRIIGLRNEIELRTSRIRSRNVKLSIANFGDTRCDTDVIPGTKSEWAVGHFL